MTTIKPHLVRADTIDLQDQNAPSAKDHSRQPQHPSPYGYGPAAPHQAQTLKRAEQEAHKQQQTSPRASEDNGGPFADSQRYYEEDDEVDDEHMNHLHGPNGTADQDRDYDDGDTSDSHDDDMDDDMMDKISSSPSIEDGKYPFSCWPPRSSSMDHRASPAPMATPTRGDSPLSSSPFISPLVHFPLPRTQNVDYDSEDLHPNKLDVWREDEAETDNYGPVVPPYGDYYGSPQSGALYPDFMTEEEIQQVSRHLLPTYDPDLDDWRDGDEGDEGFCGDEDEGDWIDEDINFPDYQSSDDEDTEEFTFSTDERFIDSGWGGECLREIENIDFEFVYALHTFVATVEGQANATKGDTMVLLDDSNSYWWLVRVVKDGSIGYLPAEHIETPTERLARLNKHRNIDLSASMLGDNAEKSKNPLKKAMRRRNAKTVQFTAPTYYEPSETNYSSDEEEGDGDAMDVDQETQNEETDASNREEAEDASSQTQSATNGIQRSTSNESLVEEPQSPDKVQAPEPLQTTLSPQDAVSRSRKGVVRNTDSFFKDDTAETKKISLTPRLLRGDSDSAASAEQDSRQRPSLDTFDKMVGVEEKPPKEEKKKEKKGMLSGLFKRKDKPSKGQKTDDRADKVSEESLRPSTNSKDSLDSTHKADVGIERKPSKLQKQPPSGTSPKSSPTEGRYPNVPPGLQTQQESAVHQSITSPPAPTAPAPPPPTVRQVQDESSQESLQPVQEPASRLDPNVHLPKRFPSLQEKRPAEAEERQSKPEAVVKPVYARQAKERFALDTSDSDDDHMSSQQRARNSVSPLNPTQTNHQRNDSGMQISPIDAPEGYGSYPQNVKHLDDGEEAPYPDQEITPIEADGTASTSKASPSTVTTHTPSTSRSEPAWSDSSLRTYMENDQDIKDLLIIVHDKSNVVPVGQDHPLMANLFTNERTKLAEMQTQLDSMLLSWMTRKNTAMLSR